MIPAISGLVSTLGPSSGGTAPDLVSSESGATTSGNTSGGGTLIVGGKKSSDSQDLKMLAIGAGIAIALWWALGDK